MTAYFISGGVGLLYYDDVPADTLEQISAYGDVGPLLARSLRENTRWRELRVERPPQTLRATVLGAASQQVTLSGSTIWADDDVLPLRNLPVIEPVFDPDFLRKDTISASLSEAVRRWDRGTPETGASVAISLGLPDRLDYAQVTALADGVSDFVREGMAPGTPLVMVTEKDYAQVLGQTIKGQIQELPLVVIDQIGLGEGDFIDIGEPMLDGRVVPVSVKTLVFYH